MNRMLLPTGPTGPGAWLLAALRQPAHFLILTVAQKDLVLRVARRAGLLASLRYALEQAGLLEALSVRVQDVLEGAWMIAVEHERSLRWEVNRIQRAFYGTGLPVILLKGAAYVMLDLPLAKGRLVADVDILLSREDLPLAEYSLNQHGWTTTKRDPYDQYYYREWMHELPPLRHRHRLTELDLHHAILPCSGRLHPDSARLLAAVEPIQNTNGVWTLAPLDRILHAMSQLFYDSDFGQGGLRDLLDLDVLLRHDHDKLDFWPRLLIRARELDLLLPLYYALYFLGKLCQTPIPSTLLDEVRKLGGPGWLSRAWMAWLVPLALLPVHPEQRGEGMVIGLARWLLYIRSHWLRMPPGLLLLHLTRKWGRKWRWLSKNQKQNLGGR